MEAEHSRSVLLAQVIDRGGRTLPANGFSPEQKKADPSRAGRGSWAVTHTGPQNHAQKESRSCREPQGQTIYGPPVLRRSWHRAVSWFPGQTLLQSPFPTNTQHHLEARKWNVCDQIWCRQTVPNQKYFSGQSSTSDLFKEIEPNFPISKQLVRSGYSVFKKSQRDYY